MRYLSLPELEQINTILGHLESDDGTRITGRLEAYSCKAAGSDKKLLKRLSDRFSPGGDKRDEFTELLGSSPPGQTGDGKVNAVLFDNQLPFKALYYLVATMNQLFPDHDFSEVRPETFRPHPRLTSVVSHVNTTLFNTGIDKNLASFGEFSSRLWERIDWVIGLAEAEIYTYTPDTFDGDAIEDDPFWERGCIWSFNYFFWNRKLKRVLVFTCRAVREVEAIMDDRLSQRSSTPVAILP